MKQIEYHNKPFKQIIPVTETGKGKIITFNDRTDYLNDCLAYFNIVDKKERNNRQYSFSNAIAKHAEENGINVKEENGTLFRS